MSKDSALEFPCDFPIKAMGLNSEDFDRVVAEIIGRHAPDLDTTNLRSRNSTSGRYRSVTLTINARSKAQLDAIYLELSSDERVIMAL